MYKRATMRCCIGIGISIAICLTPIKVYSIALAEKSTKGVLATTLPNEICETRPSLNTVGACAGDYYLLMISLHRCCGACGEYRPSFRGWESKQANTIYVNVLNQVTLENETLIFENHTAHACNCMYDSTVCSETQLWNERQCGCVCVENQSLRMQTVQAVTDGISITVDVSAM